MPLLFRVVLFRFFGLLFLSGSALLGLLLTTRFYEIAQFAAFGGIGWPLLFFVLCQIPFILPIVIAVGSALASFLLFRELSHSGMITSLRASSLSIGKLMAPLLLSAVFLSALNAFFISEVSPLSKVKARVLQKEWRGVNPLALLKQKDFLLSTGIEVTPLGSADPAKFAEKVVTVAKRPGQNRLLLLTADRLEREGSCLTGENVSFLSYGEKKEGFSDLFLDRSEKMVTDAEPLSFFFAKEKSNPSPECLTTVQLLEEVKKKEGSPFVRDKLISEGIRRLNIALSPLTFAFLGAASGLVIGRRESFKPQLILLSLIAFFLVCFFFGKSFDKKVLLSLPFFLVPHLLLNSVAFIRVKKLSRGLE